MGSSAADWARLGALVSGPRRCESSGGVSRPVEVRGGDALAEPGARCGLGGPGCAAGVSGEGEARPLLTLG